ncbi:MAG TPA: hypothetical protein VMB26_18225 [Candidatus Binataceae bacterium]|nr:hypothetical protein [Candidatus Binataceae bacterium]
MKVVTWLLGLSLIAAVLICKWLNFPLSNQMRGFRWCPLTYSPPHAIFFSYGALAALLILGWILSFQFKSARALCLFGIALLALSLTAMMQVAFYDPVLLKRLSSEAAQAQLAVYFITQYLPPNPWIEPARWRYLTFDSLFERLWTAWYFLAFGWYAAITAGVFSLSSGLQLLNRRQRYKTVLITAVVLFALGSTLCFSHVRAQRELDKAALAVSTGRVDDAIGWYRRAMRLDPWYQLSPDLYARIGQIDSNSGKTTTFEYKIYRAELLVAQGDYPSAIAEYHQVSATHDNYRNWMRVRESELWTSYGQNLLGAGATGSAVAAFENARALDPDNWLAALCLSRGYFLVGRYQQTSDLALRLLDSTSDPQLRADLYCDYGDAQTRLGNLGAAHIAYRRAWTLDEKLARRTLTALVGP